MLKICDIVRKKCGYWGYEMKDTSFDPNELHIIEKCDGGVYHIVSLETGFASAWWRESQLEFVKKGSLKDLIKANKILEYNRIKELKQRKTQWLKENYNNYIRDEMMLYLFDQIGYDSVFYCNGTRYDLEAEWNTFKPLFDAIFSNDKIETDEWIEFFKNDCCEDKVKRLFKKVNGRK